MKSLNIMFAFILMQAAGSDNAFAQVLGQDAEGYSAIVIPATTLNLDITGNVATFSLYREAALDSIPSRYDTLQDCWINNDDACMSDALQTLYSGNYFIWGFDLKGEVKDGLGTLFTDEKVANSVSGGILIGKKVNSTSLTPHAIDSIKAAFQRNKDVGTKIEQQLEKLTPDMLAIAAKAAGLTPSHLTPPAYKSADQQVRFMENRIKILSDLQFLQQEAIERSKAMAKRIKNLETMEVIIGNVEPLVKSLSQFKDLDEEIKQLNERLGKEKDTLEYAKITAAIQEKSRRMRTEDSQKAILDSIKREIYSNFRKFKPVLAAEYPADTADDPFLAAYWSQRKEKVTRDLFIEKEEIAIIEKISDLTTVPDEASGVLSIYRELVSLYNEKKESGEYFLSKAIAKHATPLSELYFLRANVKGTGYKYDLNNGSTTVKDRFVDRTFNGYTIEAGYTRNFKRYNFLGISGSINYASNIGGLTSTAFKLEKEDTSITNGTFTSSQEVKALSGTFDGFLRYDLNVDFVHLFRVSEKPGVADAKDSYLYVSLNPYLRHRIYDKSDLLKNNTIMGVGLHAYNSKSNKIMGGIFVQTADFFGVHTGEDSTFGKRITFGLVAKYNITGLKVEEKSK